MFESRCGALGRSTLLVLESVMFAFEMLISSQTFSILNKRTFERIPHIIMIQIINPTLPLKQAQQPPAISANLFTCAPGSRTNIPL